MLLKMVWAHDFAFFPNWPAFCPSSQHVFGHGPTASLLIAIHAAAEQWCVRRSEASYSFWVSMHLQDICSLFALREFWPSEAEKFLECCLTKMPFYFEDNSIDSKLWDSPSQLMLLGFSSALQCL
jgi:hypothetical protein